MSLIEVMLALSVLTIGIFASMSHFATLSNMRRMASEANTARAIVSALAERFQGSRWDMIGTDNAYWSLPRLEPGAVAASAIANEPLMDDAFVPTSERDERGLQRLGLLQTASGLTDLRVYVEFYRALTSRNEDGEVDATKPGVMDGEVGGIDYTDASHFQRMYRFDQRWSDVPAGEQSAITARRTSVRLDTGTAPTVQVGEHDPIAIRILATWGERGQYSLFTARKR